MLVVLTLLTFVVILFVSLGNTQQMVVVYESNVSLLPIELKPGKYQCSECGMIINDLNFASQVIAPKGKTWFFDDHGCMAVWVNARPFKDEAVIWVACLNTGGWIDGRKARYSRTDITPMSYGFGAYTGIRESHIDFNTMQRLMAKGETLANPAYRKQILGE